MFLFDMSCYTTIRSHFIILHAVPTLMMQCQFGCSVSHSNRTRRHALYSELNFVWLKHCCDCLIHRSVHGYEIIIRLHSLCSLILVFIRLPRAVGCCVVAQNFTNRLYNQLKAECLTSPLKPSTPAAGTSQHHLEMRKHNGTNTSRIYEGP